MTKDQIIESVWLKVKKFDPGIRKVVVSGVIDSVWREIVMKYILSAPEMGYLFAKEYSLSLIFEEESGMSFGEYIDEVYYVTPSVISPLFFKGGVFKVRSTDITFVPVRWAEFSRSGDTGIRTILNSGNIIYSVIEDKVYFKAPAGTEISGSIDLLISFKEYLHDEEVPLPISSRPDVSYFQLLVDGVLNVLVGDRPERKAIDDTNLP